MDMGKYKLPVLDTLHKSIVTIADNSLDLLKALLLPAIIMSLIAIGQILMYQHGNALIDDGVNISKVGFYMSMVNVGATIIFGVFSAIVAVTCHRVILLGKESLPNYLGIYLSRRELKYFGWVFLFGIPMGIGYILTPLIIPLFVKFINTPEVINLYNRVWSIAGLVIATFITAPFILVLPATAIGEKKAFSKARLLVSGNTIRLAVVIIIPALITILIRWALRHFGPEDNNIPYISFINLIFFVFMLFETAVLSVSYKSLANGN